MEQNREQGQQAPLLPRHPSGPAQAMEHGHARRSLDKSGGDHTRSVASQEDDAQDVREDVQCHHRLEHHESVRSLIPQARKEKKPERNCCHENQRATVLLRRGQQDRTPEQPAPSRLKPWHGWPYGECLLQVVHEESDWNDPQAS